MTHRFAFFGSLLLLLPLPAIGGELLAPVSERYANDKGTEDPDFQRHVLPLMGRVGCNTRSCHGSFQGQGGLRLSLFGYDFKADHDTLLKKDSDRVTLDDPEGSKILQKATLGIPHKGGKRLEEGSWQYRLLARWIESGAKGVEKASQFERLEVTPAEVVFEKAGQKVPLRVVAHWEDGSSEDVTCISRFRTNDESIAEVDADGVMTSVGPGDTHVVAFYDNGVAAIPVLRAVSDKVGDRYPAVATATKVDELIVAKLRKLGIVPSDLCTDAEFLRRVSLDMTGTLPTPDEVESFLSDPSTEKRAAKIDELLTRPTYAAWWATKIGDYTGNTSKTIVNNFSPVKFSDDWYRWLARKVGDNVPYDRLAAGMILATSRTDPKQSYDDFVREYSSYYRDKDPADYAARETMAHYWERTNFRKPEERTIGVSYAFLGVRLECAQCHKHPFDQWTQDDFNQFGNFFTAVGYGIAPDGRQKARELTESLGIDKLMGGKKQQKLLELAREGTTVPFTEVFLAPVAPRPNRPAATAKGKKNVAGGRVVSAKVLGGDEVSLAGAGDPRELLMEWLRRKDNPYFARAFVNRVWATYFGTGIVNPPDDMNLANPPSNGPLLDYLADGFVDHGFDMKWLHREIANTQAYQRSWHANETNNLDERNFSRSVIRRMPAEVVIDAMTQATAGESALAAATTNIDGRAIGSRSVAGKGRNAVDYAARVFGGSTRETNCDCNRSNEPNLLQSIFLQNDNELWGRIDRGDGWVVGLARSAREGANAPMNRGNLAAREIEARIKEFRAEGKAKRAEMLQTRLDEMREKKGEPREAAPPRATVSDATRATWAREAYLRTLSRPPTPEEAATADAHIAGAADPARGLRDVLWALLNTKEFVTNH